MTDSIKSIIKFVVFLSIGLGLLALAFVNLELDYDKVINGFKSANYFWIGLALLVSVLSHFLRAIRWNQMLEPMGTKPSPIHAFNAVMIGYLFNFAIPRMGEVSRCGVLNRTDKIPINQSLGTVVVERVFDMIILLIVTAVVLLLQFDVLFGFFNETFFQPILQKVNMSNSFVLIGAFAALIIFVAVFIKLIPMLKKSALFSKILNMLKGFADGFASVFKLKSPALFFIYTILIWVLYYLNTYCYLMAFGETSSIGAIATLSILVVGTFGFAAPVSGGIGAYHIFVAKGLALYGVSSVAGGVFGFVSHGMQMLMILAIGSFSLIYTLIKERKILAS